MACTCPETFAGSDEMLALGLAMKGIGHRVFELVSDHLGDDGEWAWIQRFARETGRPVTLVATSAGAFQGNKKFRIAEQARREGIEVRPQIAGRPTGVLHGLQSNFHVFVGHPTSATEIAPLPLAEKLGRRCALRSHRRRRNARLHPDALGARSGEGRAIQLRVPRAEARRRHGRRLRAQRPRSPAAGLLADFNVIDFERLALKRPEAIYDLPTGGRRLVQRVEGYRYIVKRGQATFEDGEHTGALPGRLVRGGLDSARR